MPPYQSKMFRPEETTMLNHIEWYGYKIEVVLCICLVTLVFRLVLLVTWLPHAHVQGAIGLVCLLSVIVIVVTKIARSRVLGIYACCNYHKLVDISEKKTAGQTIEMRVPWEVCWWGPCPDSSHALLAVMYTPAAPSSFLYNNACAMDA